MPCRQRQPARYSSINSRSPCRAREPAGDRRPGAIVTDLTDRENSLKKRNATVAVIGAGDFIGGEIAKKFASAGFTVFAGRRNGGKLAPLGKEIEAAGGGIHARSLDARKGEEYNAFLDDRAKHSAL